MNENQRPLERVTAIGILGAGVIVASVLLFYSVTTPAVSYTHLTLPTTPYV